MTARSMFNGHLTHWDGGKWVFSDTNDPTASTLRPCGHCKKHPTEDGYDACLGTIPGAMNACCGHGDGETQYIQYGESDKDGHWSGSDLIRGGDALAEFKRLGIGPDKISTDIRAALPEDVANEVLGKEDK